MAENSVGKRMLRNYINGTLGFAALSKATSTPAKSGFAVFVCALAGLLLSGVLLRFPFAYAVIATLSLFGAAAALRSSDMLTGALNLLAMAAALFVRSRLSPTAGN